MQLRSVLPRFRIGFGFFILFAILYQLAVSSHAFNFSLMNYISYFTIECNAFFAVLLMILGFRALSGRDSTSLQSLRGAATLYMIMTGAIFIMLLSNYEPNAAQNVGWVNFVLHYLAPLVAIVDWLYDAPSRTLGTKSALLWLTFPVYFLIYSIARGQIVGWYPYPFLSVSELGFGMVLLLATTITICVAALAWIIAWSSRWRNKSSLNS